MAVYPNKYRTTARTPLSPAETALARRIASRLRAELTSTLNSMPRKYSSSGQMSRELTINRTVCHRLLTALHPDKDELAALAEFPGVQGLKQCVKAMDKHGADKSRAASAEAAVEQFAGLISELAGSHARLVSRLSHSTTVKQPNVNRRRQYREQLFQAASMLMGRKIDARCGISVIRPNPKRPEELEYAHVRYFVGHEASPGATPLVVASSIASVVDGLEHTSVAYRTLDGAVMDANAFNALLTPFTSDPLPLTTAKDLSGRLTQVIDPRPESARRSLDIALGYAVPSLCEVPSKQDVPILLEAIHMREPAAAMVFDVYLHSSLTAGCRPSINAYVGRNSGLCDIIDRWYDHLESTPVLSVLGSGLANSASSLAPRLHEVIEHLFARIGWDASEFQGYRCEEQYPLWACDYVMAFDYRHNFSEPPNRLTIG